MVDYRLITLITAIITWIRHFAEVPDILGAFAKLRKATISFVVSVRPSVRIEQLGSHCRDFHEIWYLSNFQKSVEKIQVQWKSEKNEGYFTWGAITFLITSCSFLLRIKNFSDKSCRETQNTLCIFNNIFRKSYHLWDNVVKSCIARQATDDNMAHARFMLDIQVYTYTYSGYCLSTVTMVARKRLNVMLYVHCLSFYW
jgi:hypothetical protein